MNRKIRISMSEYADFLRINGTHVLYGENVYRIEVRLERLPVMEVERVVPTESTPMMGRAATKKVLRLLRRNKKKPGTPLSLLAVLPSVWQELTIVTADGWMCIGALI